MNAKPEAWQMTCDEMIRHLVAKNEATIEAACAAAPKAPIPGNLTRRRDHTALKIAKRGSAHMPRVQELQRKNTRLVSAAMRPRLEAFHRTEVERALSAGLPVPPHVLAEYPDLSPAFDLAAWAERHGDELPM